MDGVPADLCAKPLTEQQEEGGVERWRGVSGRWEEKNKGCRPEADSPPPPFWGTSRSLRTVNSNMASRFYEGLLVRAGEENILSS